MFINCDACHIRIGPEYITKEFIDVGEYKLCIQCYRELIDVGFVDIRTAANGTTLLFPNSETVIISRGKYKRLKQKIFALKKVNYSKVYDAILSDAEIETIL